MDGNFHCIIGATLTGMGATLVTDLWALLTTRVFKFAPANYCFVGRWIRYMPGGQFTHQNIAATPPKRAECATGWIAHYVIGIVFAFMLVLSTSGRWLDSPALIPALLFGLITVAFPYLLMQPSFGLGIAASKTPNPTQARLKSLLTHTVFGFGLYISALSVRYVQSGGA